MDSTFLIALVNKIVFVLAVLAVFYLIKLLLSQYKNKRKFQDYLAKATTLDQGQRQAAVDQLHADEQGFKQLLTRLLLTVVIGMLSLIGILYFVHQEQKIIYILLAYFVVFILGVTLYQQRFSQRNEKIKKQLPNAVDLLIHYTISDIPLEQALKMISKQTPQPLDKFFNQVVTQINAGQPISEALRSSARPYKLFLLDYFVMVVILHYESGTDTIDVLQRLVTSLRHEVIIQQKINRIRGQLNGLPIIVVFAAAFILWILSSGGQRNYFHILIYSPLGQKALILAAILFFAAILLIRRLTRVV